MAPADKITLYQFMPMPQDSPQVSPSPFCVKLEAYLILTKRPYVTEAGMPPFAPTKSVPYVSYKGEKIGDSQGIIDKLDAEHSPEYTSLESTLSQVQVQESKEVIDLAENKLYYSLVYSRFVMDDGWEHQIDEVKASIPWLLHCCLPDMIRKEQKEKCAKHGASDDTSAFQHCDAWLKRITEVLGEKPFLFGKEPHVADCSLYGLLVIAKGNVNTNPLTTAVHGNEKLMAYIERMTRLLKL